VAAGITPSTAAARGAPTRTKGIRLPNGVLTRSDQDPTGGWISKAATLSSAMIRPICAGPSWNRPARKMGTNALYVAQAALTPK